MKGLGISVYPMHAPIEKNLEYIELAHKYGFKRIFTCLLSVEGDKEKIIREFKEIIGFANKLNMEVIADVVPKVFEELNISYNDLSFLKELGVYGLRLDMGFTGLEEAIMTNNPYGLKIELNMSNGTKYIDNIVSYKANTENLLGCHNFYPHKYTGLSYEHFIKCSKAVKELGIKTAAFISSKNATFGPWPVNEGLCTLEMHREMSITTQAKHLFALGLIDYVIIANAFASEKELQDLSNINSDMLTLKVELKKDIPDIQKKIVLDELHFNRGDVSDYLIRSTESRIKYKQIKMEPFNTEDIERGDVLIDNCLYNSYAGELQIALRHINNEGKTNVVATVIEEERFLLDYIDGWKMFKFEINQ